MVSITIAITSDPVCPFCYIGALRLDRALALFRKTVAGARDDALTVQWRAHALDPAAQPGVSMPLAERMVIKAGSADKVPALQRKLAEVGRRSGIEFSFGSRIGSTRDAHRLVLFARAKEAAGHRGAGEDDEDGQDPLRGATGRLEHRLMHAVFEMYFTADGDITSHADLARAAAVAGLDEEEALAWLAGDEGKAEVDAEVAEAKAAGINGVPRYVINDRFVVDGAQDSSEFLEQLVAAREAAA